MGWWGEEATQLCQPLDAPSPSQLFTQLLTSSTQRFIYAENLFLLLCTIGCSAIANSAQLLPLLVAKRLPAPLKSFVVSIHPDEHIDPVRKFCRSASKISFSFVSLILVSYWSWWLMTILLALSNTLCSLLTSAHMTQLNPQQIESFRTCTFSLPDLSQLQRFWHEGSHLAKQFIGSLAQFENELAGTWHLKTTLFSVKDQNNTHYTFLWLSNYSQ